MTKTSTATLTLTAALCGLVSTACNDSAPKPPATANHTIVVSESNLTPFTANHGDVVIVAMNPGTNNEVITRCRDMGGKAVMDSYSATWTCVGVDF